MRGCEIPCSNSNTKPGRKIWEFAGGLGKTSIARESSAHRLGRTEEDSVKFGQKCQFLIMSPLL
jgi:hypothetical protein